MPKWEMCYIDEKVRHKFRLFKELSYKHEVHLMTPDGSKKIMESPPFEEEDIKKQLAMIIARLGSVLHSFWAIAQGLIQIR